MTFRRHEPVTPHRPTQQPRSPELTPADPKRVALLAVLVLLLIGAAGWGASRLIRGTPPTAVLTAADSAAADSARVASSYGDTGQVDSDDTAEVASAPTPHPAAFHGTWYHGDDRSRYGDSLALTLWEDGRATAHERRYVLDRTGWHVTRVERRGTWMVRQRSNRRPLLCTSWSEPTELEACAAVALSDTSAGPPLLDFAGRSWRQDGNGAGRAARPASSP